MNLRSTIPASIALVILLSLFLLPETIQGQSTAPLYPDIVEDISHLQIQNEHQREMLRFSTTHINIGDGPLQIRGGGQVQPRTIDSVDYAQCTVATQEVLDADGNVVLTNGAGAAVFHPEHNHWHQNDAARFEVRSGTLEGGLVVAGNKVTFCLVDVEATDWVKKKNTRGYFECNGDLQGLSVGWGDAYHQSTPGQELDITGAPEGIYYLTHQGDSDNHWLEIDETNNFAWINFQLSRKGANPKVAILEYSPCSGIQCGRSSNP